MTSPQISPEHLNQIYPQFLQDISEELKLTPEEQIIAGQVGPITWAKWSVSVLSGDERVAYPYKSKLPKVPPLLCNRSRSTRKTNPRLSSWLTCR